jgi:serine/threonine-protein kinase
MAAWSLFGASGLDNYEIGPVIARGGMSVVHKGRRVSDEKDVAIKLITPEHTALAEQLDIVFQKGSEGEVAAALRHDFVVRTFEFGKKGKQYWIVMEYVDGVNLKQLIDGGDPRWRNNRYRISIDVGRGLEYIHRNNLIHRDFCPKNVLLDAANRPKIIDFGLAVPAQLKNEWRFDRSGTASYMAPEQVRGHKVDVRTDIYAFGMTVYEVLTGRRPYPEAKTRQAKMTGHLNLEPVPPRKYEPTIPIPLEHVILRCIAKDPDDRFQTMTDALQAMTHIYVTFLNIPPG